jgi:hypothetical protein
MSENKMYIGNGRIGKFDSINVQLDLTQLWEYTQGEAKSKIKEWKDKSGKVHKCIDIVISPMKEENRTEYKTHSVKISDYEKQGQTRGADNDLPF